MSQQIYPVPARAKEQSHLTPQDYARMYAQSVEDPETFWAEQAKSLDWVTAPTKIKNTSFDAHNVSIKWFEDGELNVTYNCIDRHLATRGHVTAFIWEGDDPSEQRHPALPDWMVFAELRRVMTWLTPRDAELAASGKAVFGWHESHRFCAKCGEATAPAQGGWQRNCPACKASHFPRTDPVVIMLITHGNSVLVGRSPGWPQGMYSLLAGFVEPGETLEAAVRREVFEEAGVRVGEVGYLASQPWPFPASLMFGCWGHATSSDITIDPVEIEDARWITREDMMTISQGHHPEIMPARKGAIAHFLIERWLSDTLD